MSVKYRSTRGQQSGLRFEEVVLGGLATDKGLYVPETIPVFTQEKIYSMRHMQYPELAYEVISSFVKPDEIPTDKLKEIIEKSFSSFRTPEVAPSIKLKDSWILELFHGPTFAFKDVALQFLGNVFEYFLERGNIQKSISILGATSGDTGSAAIHGLRGKKNVNCFIMYPLGKVTEIQERQMTTIPDENVHCIGINGNFDDAQTIVKAAFADSDFKNTIKLGAVNSINWARILAQITYYFYSYFRVTDSAGSKLPHINYAVPTGNFGDILAGFYAKKMGLAIDQLVVCTNENDVLHRFFKTGIYEKTTSILTIAPSMDISVSSNFERYLFYLAGSSAELLKSWMDNFEKTGRLAIPVDLHQSALKDFKSHSSNKEQILTTMTELYKKEKYLVCPHTATAVAAIRALKMPSETTVCLATAHPAKFEEAIQLSLGANELVIPPRPKTLQALFSMSTRKVLLPNSLDNIKSYIFSKLPAEKKESNFWSTALIATAVVASIGFALAKYRK